MRSEEQLLEAILHHAASLGAKVSLAFEAEGGAGVPGPRARCWRGEQVIAEWPLARSAFEQLVRKTLLRAGLDPWQFRREQRGTLAVAGTWELSVSGSDAQRRRLQLQLLAAPASVPSDSAAAVEELVAGLAPEAPSAAVGAAGDGLSHYMNMILSLFVRESVRSAELGAEEVRVTYADESAAVVSVLPLRLMQELKRRLLQLAGLNPWERGPREAALRARVSASEVVALVLEVAGESFALRAAASPHSPEAVPEPVSTPALLAVLAAPHDFALRAVYADQLLELGEERGRHVSRGTASAYTPPEAMQWCGALSKLTGPRAARFVGGFVDRLWQTRAPPAPMFTAVVEDPHWATVRALALGEPLDLARDVLRQGRLTSLVALACRGEALEAAPAPLLARLKSLRLHCNDTCEGLESLVMPSLETLELDGMNSLGSFVTRRFSGWLSSVPSVVLHVQRSELAPLGELAPFFPPSIERLGAVVFENEYFPSTVVCTLHRPSQTLIVEGDGETLLRDARRALERARVRAARVCIRCTEGQLGRARRRLLHQELSRFGPLEFADAPRALTSWWLNEAPPLEAGPSTQPNPSR